MIVEIKRPEIEALIEERLRSGAFESVEDILADALEVQKCRDLWLAEGPDAV